jgi:hypothetical protein
MNFLFDNLNTNNYKLLLEKGYFLKHILEQLKPTTVDMKTSENLNFKMQPHFLRTKLDRYNENNEQMNDLDKRGALRTMTSKKSSKFRRFAPSISVGELSGTTKFFFC